MVELNGSELPNITNHTFYSSPSCTGSWPSQTVEITTFSILMTFSLIGNVLVGNAAAFYRNKPLRTAVHYFIVNMAISDLIMPVILLPSWINHAYHDDLWLVDGVLGTVLCKLVWSAWSVSTFVSIFSMTAIAADRFHAVLLHMRYALFSRNKRRLTIVATWVTSVAFRAHYIYAAKLVPRETGLYCLIQWEPASYTWEVIRITWISIFCLTCVSSIVLTVLYSSIIIFLYRQIENFHLATDIIKKRTRRNLKIVYILVIILVVFYVVWIPFHVVYFIIFLKTTIKIPCFIFWLCDKLPLLYPVVNPVVYYIFNEEYHQGFRELLCCPWPFSNKFNDCFQPSVPPQGEINVHNAEQENIELQEH